MIYDYQCNECKHEFTVQCKMSEREKAIEDDCPSCEKSNCVEQLLNKFPSSVVRNKGRKVSGPLGDRLRSIDKAYGGKSNIGGSVDLGTWS